jgi:hypothetical protein
VRCRVGVLVPGAAILAVVIALQVTRSHLPPFDAPSAFLLAAAWWALVAWVLWHAAAGRHRR